MKGEGKKQALREKGRILIHHDHAAASARRGMWDVRGWNGVWTRKEHRFCLLFFVLGETQRKGCVVVRGESDV